MADTLPARATCASCRRHCASRASDRRYCDRDPSSRRPASGPAEAGAWTSSTPLPRRLDGDRTDDASNPNRDANGSNRAGRASRADARRGCHSGSLRRARTSSKPIPYMTGSATKGYGSACMPSEVCERTSLTPDASSGVEAGRVSRPLLAEANTTPSGRHVSGHKRLWLTYV